MVKQWNVSKTKMTKSWTHLPVTILINTGSGNDLMPGGTKELPEPLLNYHDMHIYDIPN